ncbi:MAG: hypothetical protein SGPRY_009789 [Prymnesium sp.]
MRVLLREMEEHLRWKSFALQQSLEDKLSELLATEPGSSLLRTGNEPTDETSVSIDSIRRRLAHFEYASAEEFAADCFSIAADIGSDEGTIQVIEAKLNVQRAAVQEPPSDTMSLPDTTTSANAETRSPKVSHVRSNSLIAAEDDPATQLQEGFQAAGAKRSRMIEKEAKFEQFKKHQRLHPEYAGIYAETFLSTRQELQQFVELLVFREQPRRECVVGLVQVQPHTTMGELRLMLSAELGISCGNEEELMLSRGILEDIGEPSSEDGSTEHLLCPIQLTQNHKLIHTMFPLTSHVLVVEGKVKPSSIDLRDGAALQSKNDQREGLLCADVSGGHENHAIPAYNEFDDEPAPIDFTYVTQCVVNEGVRLFLGGPMREPWPCPYDDEASPLCMPYDSMGRFLYTPHTVESVYECTLASKCGMTCKNRLVQLGPRFRLEVYRCGESEGKFHKGWGVRSPDFIPQGSFLCEYVGEYISDDEAESRGIRYDKQKMSRLMDVSGDGKDVVNMCIDATNFSNLGA